MEHVAAADGDSVHRRDHGFRDVADDTVECLDLEEPRLARAVVAGLGVLLDVAARAERLLTGSGERNDADRAVAPRRLETRDELLDRVCCERVVALGPVDRNPRQTAVDLVANVRESRGVDGATLRRHARVRSG
jgi:hypothetical protein